MFSSSIVAWPVGSSINKTEDESVTSLAVSWSSCCSISKQEILERVASTIHGGSEASSASLFAVDSVIMSCCISFESGELEDLPVGGVVELNAVLDRGAEVCLGLRGWSVETRSKDGARPVCDVCNVLDNSMLDESTAVVEGFDSICGKESDAVLVLDDASGS